MSSLNKYLLILTVLVGVNATAGKLSKGFEALSIYNYFEAKRLFEKSLKNHKVPAAYGLSIIYARRDNPFYNLDSAYNNIVIAASGLFQLKLKEKEKYKKLGVDSLKIISQRNNISKLHFNRAVDVASVYGFQDFVDRNPWSVYFDTIIYLRDRLAFEEVNQSGKSSDYSLFINSYPESVFASEALFKFDKSLFAEQTADNKFIDYINFIKNYPESPYRDEAENNIYHYSTKTGTVEAYKTFIIEFPSNRNVDEAWKYLYNAKMQEEYSSANILDFSHEYPEYPYQKELMAEFNMADKLLYPVRSSSYWGFCDRTGDVVIKTIYKSVEWFKEGLSVIREGNKFGYMNKLGKVVIKSNFDDALPFNEGFALVELNELWGMIDRNGNFIIPAEYDDLGVLNSGLCFFQKDELYGFFDTKGIVRLQPQYTEAYDFENGIAIVSKNDYFGVIDVFGTTLIPFKFQNLIQYGPTNYAAEMRDVWGVINLKGDTIIDFKYDYIGRFSGKLTIVEIDDEFNYIDTAGVLVLDDWIATYPEYRQLAVYKNGHARIQFEDGYNLIDTLGKKLFKRNQENIGLYGDLVAVRKGDKWGYLNKSGQIKIVYSYSYAGTFKNDVAVVEIDPFYGLINKKGDYIIEAFQEELRFINDSILIGKSVGKYGLLTTKGDTLLNYQYNKIEPIDNLVVKLEEESDVFYYNIHTQQFIRKEN